MTEIFLGKPSANVEAWIKAHAAPIPEPEVRMTKFTLEDGTVETYDITGTLNRQCMIDNGYYIEDEGWSKTITQADIGNTVTSIDM